MTKGPRLLNRPPLRQDGPPPATKAARAAAPSLARFSAGVLSDLARKTRYVDPDLVANWPTLAGAELSRLCRPGRLTGGGGLARTGRTLEVVVPHGAAAASVEFAAETLKRRLNDYFGPGSIARIAIVQAAAPAKAPGGLSRFRTGPSRP